MATVWNLDTSVWRKHPHRAKWLVYLDQAPAVFAGTVASNFGADAVHYWAYTNSTGIPPEVGQTIKLYDVNDVLKHTGRVRRPIFAGTIYVNESSEWQLQSGDYFVVYDEYRLWSKIPFFTDYGQQRKDTDIIWNGDTSNWRPLACTNGYYVGTVDSSGSIAVWLDASDSHANVGAISTYEWTSPDGSPSTINSATGTMYFNAGRRWVTLTITDTNGNSASNKMLVVGIDGTSVAWGNAQVNQVVYDLQRGANAEITLLEDDIDIDEYHIIALVAYDAYEGTRQYAGGLAGREHMKLVGYLDDYSVEDTPEYTTRNVRVVSPSVYLKERLLGLSQIIEYTSVPTDWNQANPLNVWLINYYLLKYHTTYTDVLPVLYSPEAALYAVSGWSDDSLSAQITNINHAANLIVTSDRLGRFRLLRDWSFASTSERSGMLALGTLGADDWTTQLVTQHHLPKRTAWLEASGILADNTVIQPLFAIAAGETPSDFGAVQRLDRMLPRSQDELNEWAGQKFAYDNRGVESFELESAHLGAPIEPSLSVRAYIQADIYIFDSYLELASVVVDNDTQTQTETLRFQAFAEGTPAKTRTYIGDESDLQYQSQLPLGTLPPLEFPPPPIPTEPAGVALAVAFSDTQTAYTLNADNEIPTWQTLYGTQTSSAALDEYSNYVLNRAGALGVYILDANGTLLSYSDVENDLYSVYANELQGAYSLRAHRGSRGTVSVYGTKIIDGTAYNSDWVYQYNNPDSEGTIVSITEGSLDTAQGNPAPSFAHALIDKKFGTPRTSKLEHQLAPTAGTINDVTYI
ncbi:MAG: hypothetical protein D6712_20920, partial [Chloroflexi bacterium]